MAFLTSCAPSRTGGEAAAGLVLTPLPPESPAVAFASDLARRTQWPLLHIRDLERESARILSRLRETRPEWILVVLRPEDLDVNFQLALFELSCRVDADPFPDFIWGYFLATEKGLLPPPDLPPPSGAPTLRLEAPLPDPRPPFPCGAVVFTGLPFSGAPVTIFEPEPEREILVRRTLTPDSSFPRRILEAGGLALLAPLHRGDSRLADFEWTEAASSGASLGEILKRTYDLAVLASGYSSPTVGRFVDGRTAPTGHDQPAFMALTRVLYGDPRIRPERRAGAPTPLLIQDPPADVRDEEGRPVRHLTWRRDPPDVAPGPDALADPLTPGRQMLWLRAPCPPGTRKAWAQLQECGSAEGPVPAFIEAQALEDRPGGGIFHVLIRGEGLGSRGLRLRLTLRLR